MMALNNNTPRDQNYKKAYDLMGRVLEKYNAPLNDFYEKYDSHYDLYPGFCNRIFWEFCLPKVEFGARVKESVGSDVSVHSSIKRYKSFVSMSPKVLFRSIISYVTFFCWLIFCFATRRTNKIFVDDSIINESHRYVKLHRRMDKYDIQDLLPVFTAVSSPYRYSILPSYNILRLLKNKCIENIGAYKMWMIAIILLKPKKIIISDDKGRSTYSLVLAAKKTNTEVIGLSHGLLPSYQCFAFGFRRKNIIAWNQYRNNKKPLIYDKYYVWDEMFANALREIGSLYNKEIKVCGWLSEEYNKIDHIALKKTYVLYAIEHFCVNREASLKILLELHLGGYQVIIKKRPADPWDSSEFDNKNFIIVDEFSRDHLENAFCFVGSGTTMIIQMSIIGIPILSPLFERSYDFNIGIKMPFLKYSIDEIEASPNEHFIPTRVSDDFVREFVTDSNDDISIN
jgi:hypothetical protein